MRVLVAGKLAQARELIMKVMGVWVGGWVYVWMYVWVWVWVWWVQAGARADHEGLRSLPNKQRGARMGGLGLGLGLGIMRKPWLDQSTAWRGVFQPGQPGGMAGVGPTLGTPAAGRGRLPSYLACARNACRPSFRVQPTHWRMFPPSQPAVQDVWLEAARLQTPENAKAILARGVAALPDSGTAQLGY